MELALLQPQPVQPALRLLLQPRLLLALAPQEHGLLGVLQGLVELFPWPVRTDGPTYVGACVGVW